VFYRRLLPELQAKGKTILVITHDDRYFHLADRYIKLDSGQIVDEGSGAESGTAHHGAHPEHSAQGRNDEPGSPIARSSTAST
jgi:putative ATP-binding cassette transporter